MPCLRQTAPSALDRGEADRAARASLPARKLTRRHNWRRGQMFLRKLGQSRMASALRYHSPVSHFVGVRLACRVQAEHETVSAPKLNAIAPRQLLCPHDSMIIVSAHERSAISDVSIFPDEVCAIFVHLGDTRSGDVSHALRFAAVSFWLARRIRSCARHREAWSWLAFAGAWPGSQVAPQGKS